MKVIVDNIATEYLDNGNGPVVLMLHGWGDSLHTFDLISADLGPSYRIVRLDLPGFGGTEAPGTTWDISEYTSFVRDFCEKLELKPHVILGHSFGGRVAIKGLAEGVLKADKLILVGSAGIAKTKSLRNIVITGAAKIFGLITYIPPLLFYRSQIRKRLYQAIGSDYLDSGRLKDTFLATIHEDLREYAAKLVLPTMLIWGQDDMATPLADGKTLAKLIVGSNLEVISAAGHFVHMERHGAVARIIKDFI